MEPDRTSQLGPVPNPDEGVFGMEGCVHDQLEPGFCPQNSVKNTRNRKIIRHSTNTEANVSRSQDSITNVIGLSLKHFIERVICSLKDAFQRETQCDFRIKDDV